MDMCIAVKEDDETAAIQEALFLRGLIMQAVRSTPSLMELYWKCLLFLAPYDFDSFMLYIEKERDPKQRFYMPRRAQLRKLGVVQALQDLEDDKLDLLAMSMVPGAGKAQPLYSKVLTPDGFKPMGEVSVGDIVISGTGNYSHVIGVYPQGKKNIYELTFDDGSKCRCSGEHLWACRNRSDRVHKKPSRTIELSEMMKNLYVENDKRCNYSIEYVSPINFPEKHLPLHPYVVGVIIGNGCTSSGNLNISIGDVEVIDLFMSFLPDGFKESYKSGVDYRINDKTNHRGADGKYTKNRLRVALEELGLYGKKSSEKFIPHIYKYASKEQRLWLLRGLMDTDGYADHKGCEYSTVSKTLAQDVVDLVHSLGGYAHATEKETHYRDADGNKVKCQNAFRVTIQFWADSEPVFALTRKRYTYSPKRTGVERYLKSVEYIGEEECQCIYIDDPSHLYITDDYIVTHNTTLGEMFMSHNIGRDPEGYSLFASHSGDITRMFYDAVNNITGSSEYLWADVFPSVIRQSENAKTEQINFGKYKPFKSLQCTSVGAKNAGKVRCNKYLYCDDLIGGIEEAMSKPRLDKLWTTYSVDLRQRKKDKCKELHVATRWSVHDVIGRLEERFKDDPRARFLAFPDIDPETGESNFEYQYGVGFSVEYFHDMEETMDDVSYRCLYKSEPIEREGLLYTEEELRRYLTLPDGEPDAVLAVCDTKNKGADYLVLPSLLQYGNDYYLSLNSLCDDNSDYAVQYSRMADVIIKDKIQRLEVEANNGGDRIAETVAGMIKGRSTCSITTKYTTTNKETKIIVNAEWVKRHIIFPDRSLYRTKSDMGKFMAFLLSYTVKGKVEHDDVPDALAAFAIFVQGMMGRDTQILQSPF